MAEAPNKKRMIANARLRKSRERTSRLIKLFLFFICIALAFGLGFALRGNTNLLATLGFSQNITGEKPAAPNTPSTSKKDAFNSLSIRISEIEDVLASDSMDTYDSGEATTAALDAFSQATDDPYLRFYSQERYEALLNTQNEGYAGVGVLFSEYNGQAYVVDVFEGAPAQLEGVQEGDFVVSIDGDRSQSWARNEVTATLAQHNGSTVVITWRRPETLTAEGGEEFTTTLQCAEYDEPNVVTELVDGVGYIKIRQFTQNAGSLVSQAMASLEAEDAKAYVLDLRDNPGGYLNQAVAVASQFMSSGTIVEIRTKDGDAAKPATGRVANEKPLVVIVNKNTAAAAEVVAAALEESQRASLVGNTTLGKGSVQVLHELSFGGALRYTAALYLTPQGHAIDKVGVRPDVVVDNVPGSSEDTQKSYAIGMAASYITE